MKRSKMLLLAATTSLTSLGAYYPGSSTSRFYYEAGPFLSQENANFYFEFRVGADRPKFTLSLYAYATEQSPNYYATKELTFNYPGITGVVSENVIIPSTFTVRNSFHLAIKVLGHERGDDRLGATWCISDGVDVKVAKRIYSYEPEPWERFDTGRRIYRENNASFHIESSEVYGFGALPGMFAAGSKTRSIEIEKCRIAFKGFSDDDNLLDGGGELRLLSHLDEYPIKPFVTGFGERYLQFPLDISKVGPSASYSGMTEYKLSLRKSYYYDKRNLQMYDTDKAPHNFCFKSSSIFIPQGNGHDLQPCKFEIHLYGMSDYNDSFLIKGQINFSNVVFGDCDTASYCVVYGGPEGV